MAPYLTIDSRRVFIGLGETRLLERVWEKCREGYYIFAVMRDGATVELKQWIPTEYYETSLCETEKGERIECGDIDYIHFVARG